MSSTCFDCNAILTPKSQAIWTCTNVSCPGGKEKHLCGYCRESSFSPTSGICANPACRTHKIVRNICPSCQYHSVLTLGGMVFCINRSCPTHAGCVTSCPTCSNDSLVQLDGTAVCVKSTCNNLLYLVPWPATIGSRRGLGGNLPSAQSGAGRPTPAPGTTALRRFAVDPDATTVIPGAPTAAQFTTAQMIKPAASKYAVDVDAATVMPGVPGPSTAAKAFEQAETVTLPPAQPPAQPQSRPWTKSDEKAETVAVPPPSQPWTPANSNAKTAQNNKTTQIGVPEGFDENAETVIEPPKKSLPDGFDENAETVLQPPPRE
jgi:hypothetical protein